MSEEPQSNSSGPKELTGRIGKYEIVGPLGKGAMGMVYRAHDTMLDRDVALKVMMASIADDDELQKRFEREAKAVGKMNHESVVTVFDFGYHTDGSPYIAMELLAGADLQKTIRKEDLPLDKKVLIITRVLSGLSHAHSVGIVHRDIKPANIWIKTDGSVKIMDFGVARLTTASMTGTGAIVGTADYMSPEQVKGARVDGRSDVFSVGCMLFELLAGQRPFRAENLMAIFYKITHDEPAWEALPQGPEYDALRPLLQKALAKELGDRYQSAYDFAVDLREYLKVHATSASSRQALEDMAAPARPPAGADAATQAEGEAPTMLDGEAPTQLEGGTTRRSTVSGTAATVRATAATVRATGGRTVRPRATTTRTLPQPVPASSGSPVLYVTLGALLVAVAGLGAYVYLNRTDTGGGEIASVSTTLAPAPPPSTDPVPQATPEPPPPTVAAPPPTVSAEGKAAATVRAAQTAFGRGDYDRAVSEAQQALRADPGNQGARTVLDNALKGQQAKQRFDAAQAALRAGRFDQAISEAEAGSQLAPWDSQGPDLIGRAREAQRRAAQQAEEQRRVAARAELDGVLSRAETALTNKRYDEAIALLDQALQMDPGNSRASTARTAAVAAKALADAAATAANGGSTASGRAFVLGDTVAQAKKQSDAPPGFETGGGIDAKAATSAAATPGLLSIKVSPSQVKGGDQFTVQVDMLNQGTAPIQIQDMIVTTITNGRRSQGPVPPQVKEVAPQQTAMLLQLPGNFWREDTESWSMQVMVRTVRGESYRNTIEWK